MIDNIIWVHENPNLALLHPHWLSRNFCKKNILIYRSCNINSKVYRLKSSAKKPSFLPAYEKLLLNGG